MANNPYVNKVIYGGQTLIDISDTTAIASDVATGKYFYDASGAKVEGTSTGGSAIVIQDVEDTAGGTIRTISAVDLTGDTVIADKLAAGYTAHNNMGIAITGTASLYDLNSSICWMGKNATHLGTFYSKNYTLSQTGFNTWTPSTTASVIVAIDEGAYSFTADISQYEYFIRWRCEFLNSLNSGATKKAQIDKQLASHWQLLHRRPYGLTNFSTMTDTRPYCITVTSSSTYLIYWKTDGTHTWTTTNTYGIYQTIQAATFSSNDSNTPTVTINAPSISARCYSSYFSTTRAAEVNKAAATVKLRGDLYRIDKGFGQVRQAYIDAIDMYNNPLT